MKPLGEQVFDPQPGTPYRVRYYGNGAKGHLVHRYEDDIFWCGRLVWPEPSVLDAARITDWSLALDGRKSPTVCGDCKKREKAWQEAEKVKERQRGMAPSAFHEHTVHLDQVPVIARQFRMEESWESEMT